MPPKGKLAPKKKVQRAFSPVKPFNDSGSVLSNFPVLCLKGPGITNKNIYSRCTVLAGSTETEFKLQNEEGDTFTAASEDCRNANPPISVMNPEKMRDIGLCQKQNDYAVLDFLKARFLKNKIYTTADPLLVAVNPFRDLGICTDADIKKYRDTPSIMSLEPHTFSIAREALERLHSTKKPQTIIVTGESGAGKTEATKHCMRYFASAKHSANMDLRIQNAVMAANPVLEAFGNAKTIRNNNSSRFGRFMQLVIADGGGILNGMVSGFLLEKVRVVSQSPDERSYHIFYQLTKGATSEEKNKYHLKPVAEYKNLTANSGGCFDAPGIDDIAEMEEVRQSFKSMQLTDEETESILSVVAGVLLLGNIEFEGKTIDGVDNAASLNSTNDELLKNVCSLLKLDDYAKVSEGLQTTTKMIGKESIVTRVTKADAVLLAQSLGKAMYDTCFQWIIKKLNSTIEAPMPLFLGMLDIFGFEIFPDNSLEQLLINITNEYLQKNFTDIVFAKESALYRDEGISTDALKYKGNDHIIDLLIGKKAPTVFNSLTDACVSKSSNDKTFYSNMCKELSTNPAFVKPAGGDASLKFTVVHTIAEISYNANGFVSKNMDILKAELTEVAQASSNAVVAAMFADIEVVKGKLPVSQLIMSHFVKQLNQMMDIILKTESHFIRCVKPNETKKPLDWEDDKVLNQLDSLSIIDALQLKKVGFSWRRKFRAFVEHFQFIRMDLQYKMTHEAHSLSDEQAIATELMDDIARSLGKTKCVQGKDFQVGKTMVFMQPETADSANLLQRKVLDQFQPSVRLIESVWAREMNKKAYRSHINAATNIQSLTRRLLSVRGVKTARSLTEISAPIIN